METLKESILKNIGVGLEDAAKKWCDEMGIKKWTLDKNKLIVKEQILASEWIECPVGIEKIEGHIYLLRPTDLKILPREILGTFVINCKNLKSLEGMPEKCRNLGIMRLYNANCKGITQDADNYDFTHCKNLSLVGCPKKAKYLYLYDIEELNLDGIPQELEELRISKVKLDSYDQIPENISDTLDMPFISLEAFDNFKTNANRITISVGSNLVRVNSNNVSRKVQLATLSKLIEKKINRKVTVYKSSAV